MPLGQDKHRVELTLADEEAGDLLTVGHLAQKVATISQVPISKQKLIHKGQLETGNNPHWDLPM